MDNKKNTRNKSNSNKQNTSSNSDNSSSSSDSKQRRQRKGPFGRLNGGANRKNTGGRTNNRPKVGVSSRGTANT